MSATTDRLNLEMQDAKRNLDWTKQELDAIDNESAGIYERVMRLYHIRRENYRNYYRAKGQLKTITEKKQAA